MKRLVAPFLLSLALVTPVHRTLGQVTAEDFKRVESDVLALTESRDLMRADLQKLRDEISALRAENAKLRSDLALAGKDNVSRDELKKVVEQVQEVDKRRVADGKYVHDQLESIAKLASKPVVLPPVEDPRPPKANTRKPSTEAAADKTADDGPDLPAAYYELTVAEGDTLGIIIAASNKEHNLMVKQAHVLKANPKLKDPKKLYVGMKLKIPMVK